MKIMIKDPHAVLDYGVTLTSWLATGETVSSSTWTLTPSGLTVPTGVFTATGWSGGYFNNGTTVLIATAAGATGTLYTATVHFVTSEGRQDDRSFGLLVQNR